MEDKPNDSVHNNRGYTRRIQRYTALVGSFEPMPVSAASHPGPHSAAELIQ